MNQFPRRKKKNNNKKKEEGERERREGEYREPGNRRASLITHKMISAISIPQEEGTLEKRAVYNFAVELV